jgi:integrase
MSSRIAEAARKLGYPGIGLHSMRHTHASQLLGRSVPIPTVSKRLGHANPCITLRLYAHESDELIAARRWDDAFARHCEIVRDVSGTVITTSESLLPAHHHIVIS